MIKTQFFNDKALGFAEAVSFMRISLRECSVSVRQNDKIVRIVVPVLSMGLLNWLAQQKMFPKVFWRSADNVTSSVGIGEAWAFSSEHADECKDWEQATALIAADSECRVYMGSAFAGEVTSVEWKGFGVRRMVIPRFELIEAGGKFMFVCSLVASCDGQFLWEDAIKDLDLICPERDVAIDLLKIQERQDLPHYESWEKTITDVLGLIGSGALQKAVLSRRTDFSFSSPVDPVTVLKKLEAEEIWGYGFLYQIAADQAFLGWTPEILFQKAGNDLRVDALAGTRARSEDHLLDNDLYSELLASEKDSREHELVVTRIKEALLGLCSEVTEDKLPHILKLKHQQHRRKEIRGVLKPGVSVADIYQALHPTPAVGGVPVVEALKVIKESEPFDRGWFSGAIGILTAQGAELAVAIRSALVCGDKMYLYAGAGTVAGSSAREEWEEIEAKIRNYLDIIHA